MNLPLPPLTEHRGVRTDAPDCGIPALLLSLRTILGARGCATMRLTAGVWRGGQYICNSNTDRGSVRGCEQSVRLHAAARVWVPRVSSTCAVVRGLLNRPKPSRLCGCVSSAYATMRLPADVWVCAQYLCTCNAVRVGEHAAPASHGPAQFLSATQNDCGKQGVWIGATVCCGVSLRTCNAMMLAMLHHLTHHHACNGATDCVVSSRVWRGAQ